MATILAQHTTTRELQQKYCLARPPPPPSAPHVLALGATLSARGAALPGEAEGTLRDRALVVQQCSGLGFTVLFMV